MRWINLRACPRDQASLSRARAGMTEGQKGRTDPAAASLRHRLRRRPPKTLVSHPATCVAVDRWLARMDFAFWSTANARAGRLRRPDRSRETERSLAPDRRQELLPSAVIASHARKSLSVIEFRQVRRQPVSTFNSCVNSALQRKIVSPQWDSRTRPAKRQHRRCIGCERDLA